MNKKTKKNKAKRLAPLALVGLLTIGASAWLTNIETATNVNKITPGTMEVIFDNEKIFINGTEDASKNVLSLEDAFPMTNDYASANNDYYTFTIDNDSSVAIDYDVVIASDDYANTFTNDVAHITVAEIAADADDAAIRSALKVGKELVASEGQTLIEKSNVEEKASQRYAVMLAIDETGVKADVLGKAATVKLRINAEQHQEKEEAEMTYTLKNTTLESKLSVLDSRVANADSIVITDIEIDTNSIETVDLSEAQDKSVLGYLDGTTYYITSNKSGQKVIANTSLMYMFSNLSVTSIDVNNLDTSNTQSFYQAFAGTPFSSFIGIENLDTSNVTDLRMTFLMAQQSVLDLSK